jgi:hypothetical protein
MASVRVEFLMKWPFFSQNFFFPNFRTSLGTKSFRGNRQKSPISGKFHA